MGKEETRLASELLPPVLGFQWAGVEGVSHCALQARAETLELPATCQLCFISQQRVLRWQVRVQGAEK